MKPFYLVLPVSPMDCEEAPSDAPQIAVLKITDEFIEQLKSMRHTVVSAKVLTSGNVPVNSITFDFGTDWYKDLHGFFPSSVVEDVYGGAILKASGDFNWPAPVSGLRGEQLIITSDTFMFYLNCYDKYTGIYYETTWYDMESLLGKEEPLLSKLMHDYDMSHAWHEDVVQAGVVPACEEEVEMEVLVQHEV